MTTSMVTETGTVRSVHDGWLLVEVVKTSACQSCKAKQGCGQAVLASWGDSEEQNQKNHFKIPYYQDAHAGDVVELGMAHDTVTKVAFLTYMLPLVSGFIGVLLAEALTLSELWQLAFFVVFFIGSLVAMKGVSNSYSNTLIPKILHLYPQSKSSEVFASSGVERV